jgi:hypothetical protein
MSVLMNVVSIERSRSGDADSTARGGHRRVSFGSTVEVFQSITR